MSRIITLILLFLALGLAFPALIQICVFWKSTSGFTRTSLLVKNIIIIIVAVIGLVSGTYTSLHEIINKFFVHHD